MAERTPKQKLNHLELKMLELEECKAEIKRLKAMQDRDEAWIIQQIEELAISEEGDMNTVHYHVTRGSRVDTDIEKLKVLLKKKKRLNFVFYEVPTEYFDQERLTSLVSKGIISPEEIAECSEVKPNKPYVRISKRKEQDLVGSVKEAKAKEAVTLSRRR